MNTDRLKDTLSRARQEVGKVIIGQTEVIDKALIAIFTGHHALIEGVPGVAKTLLVRTLAQELGCSFSRIQFTPDLMPADIIGTNVFNLQRNEFTLIKGPVFASFLLADEINRAPAKTQSALLQAMQEHVVTIDRDTHTLPPNFTVFATQNPIEYEGTFPLPEAQLDRFFIRLQLGYPKDKEEIAILDAQRVIHPLETIEQVLSADELLQAQGAARDIHIADQVKAYVVAVVNATRSHPDVYLGASPRGSLALARASQAFALLQGRDFVLPDDVKRLAAPTLAHRLILQPQARLKDLAATTVIAEVLASVPVELSPTAARA